MDGTLSETDDDIISSVTGICYLGESFVYMITFANILTYLSSRGWYGAHHTSNDEDSRYIYSSQMLSQLSSFILAMVLFPEAQRQAQDELDRVVGHDRLPELSDLGELPYIEALYKEILRFALMLGNFRQHSFID